MQPAWDSPEELARASARFAAGLRNAQEFFMGKAPVHSALEKLAHELDEARIPYAVAGALALNARGFQRVTVDVDILVTREGLAAIKTLLLGRGWVEKFPGSNGLRDTEFNVTIDVLIAGEYPGDGKPKSVVFPDPSSLPREAGAIPFLSLDRLIELKLASGISAPHRLKDLADVEALVKATHLPEDFAERLDPSVRVKYRELWALAQVHDPISED
jgi:hypothetical protein